MVAEPSDLIGSAGSLSIPPSHTRKTSFRDKRLRGTKQDKAGGDKPVRREPSPDRAPCSDRTNRESEPNKVVTALVRDYPQFSSRMRHAQNPPALVTFFAEPFKTQTNHSLPKVGFLSCSVGSLFGERARVTLSRIEVKVEDGLVDVREGSREMPGISLPRDSMSGAVDVMACGGLAEV